MAAFSCYICYSGLAVYAGAIWNHSYPIQVESHFFVEGTVGNERDFLALNRAKSHVVHVEVDFSLSQSIIDGVNTLAEENLGEELSDCECDPDIILLHQTQQNSGIIYEISLRGGIVCTEASAHRVDVLLR